MKTELEKWHVNRACESLSTCQLNISSNKYSAIFHLIEKILKAWSDKWCGNNDWQSFLNRKTILHEMEEAILPLHYIFESLKFLDGKTIIFDVCAGKGYLGALLAYAPCFCDFLNKKINKIVLIDKNQDIKWDHIVNMNNECDPNSTSVCSRIPIEIWGNQNIYDDGFPNLLCNSISSYDHCVLNGTHLCRRLSSRFVETLQLIIRRSELHCKVALAILSPCCIPRFSGTVTISVPQEQVVGIDDKLYFQCWKCGSEEHQRQSCFATSEVRKAFRKTKQGNGVRSSVISSLDMSELQSAPDPYELWCDFLQRSMQLDGVDGSVEGIYVDLDRPHVEALDRDSANWNDSRKSMWLVYKLKI